MTQFNTPTYDIERPMGHCAFTGRKLEVGEHYMAALVETELALIASGSGGQSAKPQAAATAGVLGFKRLDVSMEAWQKGDRPENVFSYWRSTVPEANQKKKLFVDDEVLLNLFRRLADADQPQRLAFRFVLALVLMRKKFLKYDGTEYDMSPAVDGGAPLKREWWRVLPKGDPEPLRVLNPQLDEPQIQQVTEQLGEILEAEL